MEATVIEPSWFSSAFFVYADLLLDGITINKTRTVGVGFAIVYNSSLTINNSWGCQSLSQSLFTIENGNLLIQNTSFTLSTCGKSVFHATNSSIWVFHSL